MNPNDAKLPARAPGPGRPPSPEKRAALIDAAIEEFAATGFDGASVDAIAQRAAVSKRTLYKHFQSKDKLFEALVDAAAQRIRDFTAIEYSATLPLKRQLMAFAEQSRSLNTRPETLRLLRAVVSEHIRHPERVEPLLRPFSSTGYGFGLWADAARRDGRLQGDAERMGQLLGSLMRSLIFWPAIIQRAASPAAGPADGLHDAMDMFLTYYGARPDDLL